MSDQDEVDVVDEMIKKTGCMDFHVKVQVKHVQYYNYIRSIDTRDL